MLGVFCKTALNVTLRGVTSNLLDPSVDHLKVAGLATLRRFILDDEGLDLKIVNRGNVIVKNVKIIYIFIRLFRLSSYDIIFSS